MSFSGFGTRNAPLFHVAALLLVASTLHLQAQTVCSKIWTLNADFDEGVLINVNHDVMDQLQLNTVTTPPPFIYVACSGRGTVVRIDVNTGTILGEYWTAPAGMAKNPSRTTVDQLGNCWVANRDEASWSGGAAKGSVTRIAIVIGGTRCDADGTPNLTGQYLKPPFLYSTAIDRDGDGLIKTSSGLGNILGWTNAGGADTHGGVSTADDECIINYTRTAGTNARTVAVDANNDVWVGGLGNQQHEKISGLTGLPVAGTLYAASCGGYGGLIDGNGILWSARGGSGLLRFNTATSAGTCYGSSYGDYGLGIDPSTGQIWHTNVEGNRVAKLAPDGSLIGAYSHGNWYAQGVAVDNSGNVWVAHSLLGPQTTVGHLRTNGTYVGNVTVGSGPTGVAVDANGKIWVTNYYSHTAMRIDPSAGPIGGGGFPVGAVDLTVDLGSNAYPYNYSDMTGAVGLGSTSWQGSWSVVFNSMEAGTGWGKISWTENKPAGTNVIVEARAAATQAALGSTPFVTVSNGVTLCGTAAELTGQYVEIRARLIGDPSATPPVSPVLYDLALEVCDKTAPVITLNADRELWPPDHKYVTVALADMVAAVSDNCDETLEEADVEIFTVWSDEPENIVPGGDDGNTVDDIVIADDCASVNLRSERIGTGGNGRVYTIVLSVTDAAGNTGQAQYKVSVPHDESGMPAVDDGAASGYTVNSDCYAAPKYAGRIATVPEGYELDQNYPNPFNPVTTIDWYQPEAARVALVVFDVYGRRVAEVASGLFPVGRHSRTFNASDLPSGTYIYVLRAGDVTLQRRMSVLK